MEMLRVGVFATEFGWRMAGAGEAEDYKSRSLAVRAAYRLARLARWRGAEVQVLIQERPGEALTESPLSRLPWTDD